MASVEIPIEDSPIPNALDQYYSFLRNLLEPSDDQNVALNSTLVTFDIIEDADLYTENVFRGFADRKVALSPTNFGFGGAGVSDRFSELYTDMLGVIVSTVDRSLDREEEEKIGSLKRDLKSAETELEEAYITMEERWQRHKTASGIKDDDPEFLEKKIAYFNTFEFARKLRRVRGEIAGVNEDIDFIRQRAYPDNDARLLARYYRDASDPGSEVARPNSPRLEAEKGYDELQLGQMWVYGNVGGVFDVSADVRPSGTLKYFLDNEGIRDFSIERGKKSEHVHDRAWSASGSARKGLFFKASVSAEYKEHYERSIKKTRSIKFGFKNVAEFWVRRGRWYSSGVFDFQRVQDFLKEHNRYAADLSYVITSVVLGRGLYAELLFDDLDEEEAWHKLDVKGSTSFSAFGVNVPVAGADYNEYTFDKEVNTEKKTVTFRDSDNHCRVLAFRVERLLSMDDERRALHYLPFAEVAPELEQMLRDGTLSYKRFQDLLIGATTYGSGVRLKDEIARLTRERQ